MLAYQTSCCCCNQVEVGFKLEDQQGPAAEWIALDPVQRDIKRKFRKMLLGFQTDKDGPRHYMDAIKRMCRGAYALARLRSKGARSSEASPPHVLVYVACFGSPVGSTCANPSALP